MQYLFPMKLFFIKFLAFLFVFNSQFQLQLVFSISCNSTFKHHTSVLLYLFTKMFTNHLFKIFYSSNITFIKSVTCWFVYLFEKKTMLTVIDIYIFDSGMDDQLHYSFDLSAAISWLKFKISLKNSHIRIFIFVSCAFGNYQPI